MIVGTAGHVDHGKTALVKALTGIDTDRLPEEKRRGITLELGFAHLELPGAGVISLVDMPGHERFVKAMAAGAGGIDAVMLIIAADEGVMPQTREHVDICTLLGVRAGLVVLSKADLLPDLGAEWRAMLESDVSALLAGTFLETAPRLEVSARNGDGVGRLKQALSAMAQLAERRSPMEGPFFMPIDRAFTIKGFGCVVTGTVRSGRLVASDEVALMPGAAEALRQRGLQVHGQAVAQVEAGQRAAVNLAGVETSAVHRGMALTRFGQLSAATSLDVELALLASAEHPLPRRSRQMLSLGTAQVEAVVQLLEVDSLTPGASGYAQVRLAKPIAALPGQRFIVRGTRALPGRGATLGGGRVLALNSRRRRKSVESGLGALSQGDLQTRLSWLLTEAGAAGLTERELFTRASSSEKELSRALELAGSRGQLLLVDKEHRRWLASPVFEALRRRALDRLEAFHLESPERDGMSREELRQRLGLTQERTFARIITSLTEAKKVEASGEAIRLAGRGRSFDATTSTLRKRVVEVFAASGLAPPALELVASRVSVEPVRVLEVVKSLVAERVLVKAGEHYFEAGAVMALEARVRAHFQRSPTLSTAELKELVGQSRKFSIPLAEYFDAQQVTLRVGDLRTLRSH